MATSTGLYHRSYKAELALRHTKAEYSRLLMIIAGLIALPYLVNLLSLIHI